MRYEFKYLIPFYFIEQLKKDIQVFCKFDDNCNDNGFYKISSIYFDDILKYNFNSKERGINIRSKPRLRFYLDSKEKKILNSFFEFKERINDAGKKQRFKYDLIYPKKFSYNFFIKKLPPELKVKFNIYNYKPISTISYKRYSFYSIYDTEHRITLDESICVSEEIDVLNIKKRKQVFKNNDAVLELKFSKKVPFWIKSILKKYKLKQEAISKYSLGNYKLIEENSKAGLI